MLRSFVTKSIAVDRNFISFSGIWSPQIFGQIDLMVGHVCTILTRPMVETFYSTVNLMMALMKNRVSEIHPLGIVMVSTKFHTDP